MVSQAPRRVSHSVGEHAFSLIAGKKDIMNASKKTFISSTMWTERVGPTAALAALKEMDKIKSWKKISKIGNYIKKNLHPYLKIYF